MFQHAGVLVELNLLVNFSGCLQFSIEKKCLSQGIQTFAFCDPTQMVITLNLYRKDLPKVIEKFLADRGPDDRYTSFDYCYNYFRNATPNSLTKNMETSCLTLGFYLASWGMLRGSSYLLNKSVKHFQPTIEYIATLEKSVWKIDLDRYTAENMELILGIYEELIETLDVGGKAHRTLVTKIMLGVFGFIPAFDQYFKDAFGRIFKGECAFNTVSKMSLGCLSEFYEANRSEINKISGRTRTYDFETGKKTKLKYPKAKIVDMYGFMTGK